MNFHQVLLAPLTILINRSRVASAEHTTLRYLEHVTPNSCLDDLTNATAQLLTDVDHVHKVFEKFAALNSSSKRIWKRTNFEKYVNTKFPNNQAATACVSLLWRMFCSSAYYPFPASVIADQQKLNPQELEIDFPAFQRAFALLVLRGFELLGAKQNGRPLKRKIETAYSDKAPRLARIIFRCLSIPSSERATRSRATQEETQVQDVKDTIAFTQPITYDSYPYGPSIDDDHFEAAACRLVASAADKPPRLPNSSCVLPKADLQSLIQLLLLLEPLDRRWRDGLFMMDAYQRSGDVQYSRLVFDPEEAVRASDFAATFMDSKFSSREDFVLWDFFERWSCSHVSCSS